MENQLKGIKTTQVHTTKNLRGPADFGNTFFCVGFIQAIS